MTQDGVIVSEASVESKPNESNNLSENSILSNPPPQEDQNMEPEVNGSPPNTNGKH